MPRRSYRPRRNKRNAKRKRRSRYTNAVVRVKRSQVAFNTLVTPVGPGFSSNGQGFTLSQVTNYTEFTNLFDQYRIAGVRMEFINQTPQSGGSISGVGGACPMIFSIIDPDDSTAITTKEAFLEDSRCKGRLWTGRYSIYIKRPRVNFDAGNIANAGSASTSTWLDCGTPAVLHHGLKWLVLADPAINLTTSYYLKTTYYLEFKHMR